MDARTFPEGVLGGHSSIKGFRIAATDGHVGRVSWASYATGESYLVVTTGLLRRRHRVLPAAAVTLVGDGEVRVGLSRSEIGRLPLLPYPEAVVDERTAQQMLNAFERAAAYPQDGGF
ncbi:MAG: hypothetical protein ACRDPA_18875 [Solirubrobacteraceae bacterium]